MDHGEIMALQFVVAGGTARLDTQRGDICVNMLMFT
jgi:hypothetical protein